MQGAQTSLVTNAGSIDSFLRSNAVTSRPTPRANTYPTTPVGAGASSTFTFTFSFASSVTITSGGVFTLGASGSDFQDVGTGTCDTNGYPYTYAASSTCTMVVSFTPSKPGNRQGAVVLYTSTAGSYYYGVVNGIGSGPQVTFSTATPTIGTIASGLNAFNSAIDGAGNLWVTDPAGGTVKEFVAANGVYSSTPTNIFTGFTTPQGIAIDGIGNVYVGDGSKGYVWRLTSTNGIVSPGTSPVSYISFLTAGTQPIYVTMDPTFSYLYFIGVYGGSKYLIYCTLSSGTCGLVTTFTAPSGLATDSAGYKYIAESSLGTVVQLPVAYNASTKTTLISGLTAPTGLATDAAGDLYVATQGAGTSGAGSVIEYLASSGLVSTSSSSRTLATGLFAPYGIAVDSSGNLFIADTSNNSVKYMDKTDAPGLAFPNTAVGNASASIPVTLQNIGNTALNFPSTPVAYDTTGQFGLYVGSTCPYAAAGTLAYGSTCNYMPGYAPTSSGSYTGYLNIFNNNLNVTNATQTIRLTGSTGGLTLEVVGATVAKGNKAVPIQVLVGWGGNTASTALPVVKVNGSSSGVGAVTCISKLGHQNCSLTYDASSLNPGNYTISATVAANGPYPTTTATGTLAITGSSSNASSGLPARQTAAPSRAVATPGRAGSL